MLSNLAQAFATEIREHDWSDSPYRLDRAGHRRESDRGSRRSEQELDDRQTDRVRTNVMWTTAQVLLHQDPNLNVLEFAEQCGVPTWVTRNSAGKESGVLRMGLRLGEGGLAQLGSRSTFSAVFLTQQRVGSTTAVVLTMPADGEYPEILHDPTHEYRGAWRRISDHEPVAYTSIT